MFLKIQANLVSQSWMRFVQYEGTNPQSVVNAFALVIFINNLLSQLTLKLQPHTLGYLITLPLETLQKMILVRQHVNFKIK